VEKTVLHELVHAFDASRKGAFDSLCHLVACGEIRASAIGIAYNIVVAPQSTDNVTNAKNAIGQCNDVKPESKKKECILRDAINSTRQHCGAEAEKVVQQVYEKCVRDEAPFA
jgi:inner membrane protease ATP23